MTTTHTHAGGSDAHGTVARPRSVQWLVALSMIDVCLGLVIIATFLALARTPDGWAGLFYPAAIVVAVPTAVEMLLALAIRRGRRWAWVNQLVLTAIGAPLVVGDLGGSTRFDLWNNALIAWSAVQLAIVVLLVVRPTRTFVRAVPTAL